MDTDTTCKSTCGCQGRTAVEALAGALFASGLAKRPQEAKDSASSVEYLLREYGYKIVPRS